MRDARPVRKRAPAKLNLGLAIVGRRDDGYHELVTIFQAVDLYDELTLAVADRTRLAGHDPTGGNEPNLALVAGERLVALAGSAGGLSIRLRKRIPIASGLGGASSDAAAVLRGGRSLLAPRLSDAALDRLAAGIGSDVPFLLNGGAALATGRGEELQPLPRPASETFVVVSPRMIIPRKTATLFSLLREDDFADGAAIVEQAVRWRRGERLAPELLGNGFSRALAALRPELAGLPPLLKRWGAPAVVLSGAGPSHYVPFADREQAARFAATIAKRLGSRAEVFVVRGVRRRSDGAYRSLGDAEGLASEDERGASTVGSVAERNRESA